MKKVIALALIILLVGCGLFRNSSVKHASKKDFTVNHDVVVYKGKPFAKLQAMTWSLDGGELVKEFNFQLIDSKDLSVIGGMIDFLSDRHQGDEIEVEFNIENGNNDFKL
jgi:hypothetical protein